MILTLTILFGIFLHISPVPAQLLRLCPEREKENESVFEHNGKNKNKL